MAAVHSPCCEHTGREREHEGRRGTHLRLLRFSAMTRFHWRALAVLLLATVTAAAWTFIILTETVLSGP
jgi:hypothetical protein